MLPITQLVTNTGGEGTALNDVHRGGALQDRLKLGLERPVISRSALLQLVDGSVFEIPDQYVSHGRTLAI